MAVGLMRCFLVISKKDSKNSLAYPYSTNHSVSQATYDQLAFNG